ncbi:MAG: recombination protein RecR [Bacteroidales bacterium]|nr:recombination protein RecR [Bacteroidales bacterium]
MDQISSVLLKRCVSEFSKLPGIGKKTALRLAIHLLKQKTDYAVSLGSSIIEFREKIKFCKKCHNISEGDLCEICSGIKRNHSQICVVENIQDVISVENTMQYNGIYHILNGVISPMDGVGPMDLNIDSLVQRIENDNVDEIVLALPTTIEGDTTSFFIYKKLSDTVNSITSIARGVSVGDELEYIDELTLGRSIINRMPYSGK